MLLSGCFLMRRFKTRWLAVWVAALPLVFLAGCSSTSLVKTYDGPAIDVSRSAILSVADGIEVISVNGKEVKSYLMPQLDINYQILPGENSVVFTHETLWAKPGKKEDGESNSELVVTKPMQVNFSAKAGEVYRFTFGQPENRAEAYDFAKTFKATLVDSSEGFIAESMLYSEAGAVTSEVASTSVSSASVGASSVAAASSAPIAVAGAGAAVGVAVASSPSPSVTTSTAVAGTTQGGALPTIEGLKVLWDSASTNEKKEFLKWAFK